MFGREITVPGEAAGGRLSAESETQPNEEEAIKTTLTCTGK